jgi:hypothetical protein
MSEEEAKPLAESGIAHFRSRDGYPQRSPVVIMWTGSKEGPRDDEADALVRLGLATKHGPHGNGQYALWLTDAGIAVRDGALVSDCSTLQVAG